eukprot:TRINITY_DN992_c0_g1_i2.p1 TRINITY_DN992_c0_g1~~TRINITY_DN992_c0_g1_i2.p1  ORF type:complete len:149 (-),score=56.86 TRINITY_DN992_c0_g1_i2:62-508(-)
MYEDRGETRTNMQLRQLIREADPEAIDGISYKSFLTIIAKDKKGISKSALGGIFVELLQRVEAKQHTTNTSIGRKANIFEQQAAGQANDNIDETNIKRQRDARREQETRKREAAARLKKEEEEAAVREAERKRKVAEGLARLKANING